MLQVASVLASGCVHALQWLDVSSNCLKVTSAHALAKALPCLPRLRILHAADNAFGDVGCASLAAAAEALASRSRLEVFV